MKIAINKRSRQTASVTGIASGLAVGVPDASLVGTLVMVAGVAPIASTLTVGTPEATMVQVGSPMVADVTGIASTLVLGTPDASLVGATPPMISNAVSMTSTLSAGTPGASFSGSLPNFPAGSKFVATTGDDAALGTEGAPWQTMRKGLTSLSAGDTLVVRGGTYSEVLGGSSPIAIRQGTSASRITVMAYPGETPVLQGLLWLARPSYWTFDGINVTWADGQASTYHMVRLMNGAGWIFKNAEVWGAKSYAGILVAGTITSEPTNWQITGCTIHDTYASNSTNQDQGIYCNTANPSGTGLIERNIIYNCLNGSGIKLAGAASGDVGTHNVTVRYNTIYNTAQNILVGWKSANNAIYRNLLKKTGTNYSCIRGYQLAGTGNVASQNWGHEAKSMLLNDPGYLAVADGGGNSFGLDPQLTSLTVPYDFHPGYVPAQGYGRYA